MRLIVEIEKGWAEEEISILDKDILTIWSSQEIPNFI